jgi:hypothetical protein
MCQGLLERPVCPPCAQPFFPISQRCRHLPFSPSYAAAESATNARTVELKRAATMHHSEWQTGGGMWRAMKQRQKGICVRAEYTLR